MWTENAEEIGSSNPGGTMTMQALLESLTSHIDVAVERFARDMQDEMKDNNDALIAEMRALRDSVAGGGPHDNAVSKPRRESTWGLFGGWNGGSGSSSNGNGSAAAGGSGGGLDLAMANVEALWDQRSSKYAAFEYDHGLSNSKSLANEQAVRHDSLDATLSRGQGPCEREARSNRGTSATMRKTRFVSTDINSTLLPDASPAPAAAGAKERRESRRASDELLRSKKSTRCGSLDASKVSRPWRRWSDATKDGSLKEPSGVKEASAPVAGNRFSMNFNRGSNNGRNSNISVGRGSTVGLERHGSIHTLDDAKALQVHDASDVDKLIKSIKNSRKSADAANSKQRDWGANSLQSPGMIAPDSKLRLRWDGITMVMILLSCVLHPIQMAWSQQFDGDGGGWVAFDLLVCGWFILTIVLNFRTGVLDNGVVLINPKVVARSYATGWLFVDLLAALPVFSLRDALGAAATTESGSIVI